MKYDALFFDADGVLIQNEYLFSKCLTRDYGLKQENMLPFFKGAFKPCSLGKADVRAELAKVLEAWEWRGTVDELMAYWLTTGTEIDQDVLAYVTSLHNQGIPCFMATDQERYRGEYLEERFGHGRPFERVFYSAALGASKDIPAFWDKVFFTINDGNATELQKERTLFIDDDPKNIDVAKAYGMDGYLYTDLEALKRFLA